MLKKKVQICSKPLRLGFEWMQHLYVYLEVILKNLFHFIWDNEKKKLMLNWFFACFKELLSFPL